MTFDVNAIFTLLLSSDDTHILFLGTGCYRWSRVQIYFEHDLKLLHRSLLCRQSYIHHTLSLQRWALIFSDKMPVIVLDTVGFDLWYSYELSTDGLSAAISLVQSRHHHAPLPHVFAMLTMKDGLFSSNCMSACLTLA
jgi:hypothetical protein